MTDGSEISPKDLKILRKNCKRYEKSCQKLHKEVEELKQEANKLKEEKQKEHEDNLKEQKQRNEEHAEEMQTLHDRIKTDEELQKRLEKTQGDIQQYKDQIESLRNRNSEFTVSCEQKDSTIEQLRCDVCEKDCRIKTIQNTLQETDEILKKTLEGMEWYENDIIKYNLEVDRVNDLNAILYEENTQMKHKVEHYQVNVVEYKNSCRDMERKDQACMEQISKLETQVTQLKAKIYDKENNTKDIAQTFHTYENILRDKDEENGVQMEVIKERDITIDDLTRQIKEFNEQIPELNKQILEQREEMELLRHIVNERDRELHQERSLLTEYSEKYNYAIETVEHYSSQLTTCFNETSALQQHVATQESLQHEKERELLQLTTELQVVGQTMKELELKNGLINGV